MQNFWVQPSQVKSNDKVISGQQNLLPKAGSVPKPAAGVLDKAYFESIKLDHTKAINYLKSCGVTWNDHSHAGINWMRAMQAYNATLGNQNKGKMMSVAPTQLTSQATIQTAQVAQNPQRKGVTLTAAQQAEVDAGKNGKEKVVILKKILGNNGCKVYAKQLGITWNEHSHNAIDIMRMTMALKAHFDTIDGTVSPTKDNQNAKKDDTQQQPTPPPSDKLEIPANATERLKNLINLINGVTDTSTLELIQKSGFVPEDVQAHDFVEKKLWEEYNTRIVKASNSSSSRNGAQMYYRDGDSFGKDVSELTTKIFKGLPKKLIKQAIGSCDLSSDNMMFQMAKPGSGISIINDVSTKYTGGSKFSSNSFVQMMSRFSELSAYDDDKYSCMGATSSSDASERISQFDSSKEGFVRILRHIGDTQPELKTETEQMIQEYSDLISLCKNDTVLLFKVLSKDFSEIKIHHENCEREEEAIQVLQTYMKSQGFTDTEIDATLSNTEYGSIDYWSGKLSVKESKIAGYGKYKMDSSGNKVVIDLNSIHTSDGTSLSSYLRSSSRISTERTMHEVYLGKKTEYSEPLSEDDYNKIVDLSCKLFGTKIVDKTTGATPSIPASQRQWSDNKELMYTPDLNDERAAIMMNLSYACQGMRLRGQIDTNIYMCPNSTANQQGNDMTGNYSYYSPNPNIVSFGSTNTTRFSSKAEELAQIDKQLSQIKTFSLDYHKKLVEYTEHEGNPTFKKNYWDDYRTSSDAKVASVALGAKRLTSDSFIISDPAVDLLVDQLVDAAVYCPQNFNTRVTTSEKLSVDVRKKLGHIGYTFKDYNTKNQSSVGVKDLREKALAAAHCSLSFVDQSTRQSVEHEVKINFDRVDASGKRVHKAQRVYDNRTLVFHSGVYEVKNSQAKEAFDAEAKRMGETPKHTYHGTSYSGACGIVGVDGRFRFQRNDCLPGQAYTGTMLGEGIYVAKMVGKNCPYIGNDKYSYTSYTASDIDTKGRADGVLIICDTVFGKYGEFSDSTTAQRNNKNEGGTYDSVAIGAGALMPGGGAVKEYECIVTRQNMVAPKYLVDCGARRR